MYLRRLRPAQGGVDGDDGGGDVAGEEQGGDEIDGEVEQQQRRLDEVDGAVQHDAAHLGV